MAKKTDVLKKVDEVIEKKEEVERILTGREEQEEVRPAVTTTKNITAKPIVALEGPIEVKASSVKIQVVKRVKCSIGNINYLFLPGKEYVVPRNVMEVLMQGKVLQRVY